MRQNCKLLSTNSVGLYSQFAPSQCRTDQFRHKWHIISFTAKFTKRHFACKRIPPTLLPNAQHTFAKLAWALECMHATLIRPTNPAILTAHCSLMCFFHLWFGVQHRTRTVTVSINLRAQTQPKFKLAKVKVIKRHRANSGGSKRAKWTCTACEHVRVCLWCCSSFAGPLGPAASCAVETHLVPHFGHH